MAAGYMNLRRKRDEIIDYLAAQKIASQLADRLFGAKFITRAVYEHAQLFAPDEFEVERGRVTMMFNAVLSSVKLNPSIRYQQFLAILKEIDGLDDIVKFIDGDGDTGDHGGTVHVPSEGPEKATEAMLKAIQYRGATAGVVTQPLTTADRLDIIAYLYGADPHIVLQLGIVLGIHPYRLEYIQFPSPVHNLVFLWLQRVDQVDANGGPTWATLEKALRHVTVGMNGIADDIKRDQLGC